MAFFLQVLTFAAGLLLMLAGLDKLLWSGAARWSDTVRRRGATGRVWGGVELAVGLVALIFLSMAHRDSWAGVVTDTRASAALALVYALFVGASVWRSVRHPGTNCGCSALLDVPLHRPLSLVTGRAVLLASSCAGYSLAHDGSTLAGATEWALLWLAATTVALLLFVLPYVHHERSRRLFDEHRRPVAVTATA